MTFTQEIYLILLAIGLSLLVHYLIIDLTHKKGIFLDHFEKVQKAHIHPTPRIGGLGIFLSSMLIIVNKDIGASLMIASIPAFLAGFLEDYSGKVAPLQRLAIMFLSPFLAIILLQSATITHIGNFQIPIAISMAFTALISTAMVNGVNFTDGQNGLAGGTVFISTISMCCLAYLLNDNSLVYICAIIAAGVLSFLIYNYPNGKIFLGDGGAYFCGFIITIIAIIIYNRHQSEVSILMIPTLLIYPLWEVTFSTIRKLFIEKISPLRSDKYHLHQLIYRNQAQGKEYLPTLYILPIQIVISYLTMIWYDNSLILMTIIVSYITIYIIVYYYSKKLDIQRRALAIRKK